MLFLNIQRKDFKSDGSIEGNPKVGDSQIQDGEATSS